MGLTLKGDKKTLNVSYPGFFMLRKDLATLTDKDFGAAYGQLAEILQLPEDHKHLVMKHWNQTCNEAIKMYKLQADSNISDDFFGFFFAADSDGMLTVQGCKDLLAVVSQADSEDVKKFSMTELSSRGSNTVTGQDFLDLIRDCVDNDTDLEWY